MTRGCQECQGISRRGLLKGAAGIGALMSLGTQSLGTRMAFADAASYDGDVLVVLSLRGGFDGISAVVPAGDPAYYAARPTIAVPKASLLPVDGMWGLHPALAPLQPYWTAGTMGAVMAVGCPDPTRSHFEATAEMERAAPGSTLRTGWLDRALGLRSLGTVFQAAQVGDSSPSQQLAGPFNELSLGKLDDFDLAAANDDDATWAARESARWRNAVMALYAHAPVPIAAPAQAALSALGTVHQLRASAYTPDNGASYEPCATWPGSSRATSACRSRRSTSVTGTCTTASARSRPVGCTTTSPSWPTRSRPSCRTSAPA